MSRGLQGVGVRVRVSYNASNRVRVRLRAKSNSGLKAYGHIGRGKVGLSSHFDFLSVTIVFYVCVVAECRQPSGARCLEYSGPHAHAGDGGG
jgi:hypothetical protein